MKRSFTKMGIYCSLFLLVAGAAKAQMADTTAEFKPHGTLWGYAFGDLAYKGSTDNIGTAAAPVYRGGSNQYTGMPANANMFQFRRIYLGYNYDISKHFSAEFLLAAEDDFNAGLDNQSAGDVLQNGKFSPYVKLANIRWKNIFKNSDLVFGQQNTPAFAKQGRNDQTSEEVWSYRSIERTVTDIRRTPSFDFGMNLQGWFDSKGNFGYVAMVGNGTSAKVENDNFKWFYGDIFAKFLDKRLVIDLYQDYEKLNWGVYVPISSTNSKPSLNGPWYHDRNMTKLFAAWNTKKLTVGLEVYQNTIMGDVKVTGKDGSTYYRTTRAMSESFFVRGRIVSSSTGPATLGFFARVDNYDPSGNLSNIVSDANTKSYSASVSNYEPTTKEMFVTFGLDYQPIKNVHIMPNVWMDAYNSDLSATGTNGIGTKYTSMNSNVTNNKGTDAVYRLTLYYIYGK
jgi:hypothetical protein